MTAEYPEHEKLKAVAAESQKLGQVLENLRFAPKSHWRSIALSLEEYLSESNHLYKFAVWFEANHKEQRLQPIQKILANYFGIDLNKLDDEKRAMLESMRSSR
jgi:hypothetical protein